MKAVTSYGRDGNGYLVVNLHKNSASNVIPVHTIVAQAFIPNNNNLPTVNHIDGDKHNNRVENLEWASYSTNNSHALITGLRNPRTNPINQYAADNSFIRSFNSVSEAARVTGISRGMISHCIHGRAKYAGGFIWIKVSESQTTIPQGSTREDELPVEAQRPRNNAEDIVYAVSNNGQT